MFCGKCELQNMENGPASKFKYLYCCKIEKFLHLPMQAVYWLP